MEFLDELARRLNPGHILEDPGPAESGVYLDLAVLLAVVLLTAGLVTLRPSLLAGPSAFNQRLAQRYASVLVWLAVVGLLAIGLRYTAAPFFAKRLWLALDLLAIAALLAHFVWYRLARYRADLLASQEAERRRRFRPGAARARVRRGRASARRR